MAGESTGVSTRVWTVPNVLSMLRLLLVPVFLLLIVQGRYVAALVVLVIASFTDLLDGFIARHFNQVTRLGQLLDPAADRLYIFAALIGLAAQGLVPWWIVTVIILRDVLLIVRRGPNAGARFLLDTDVTTVGRHPDADIFLDDVTVSRKHAEFLRHRTAFEVKDLSSLNGTYFDGVRIETALLSDGAEVQIGKYRLTFYACLLYTSPSPRD